MTKQTIYVGRRPIESLTAAKNPGLRPCNIMLLLASQFGTYYIVIVRFMIEIVTPMSDAMARIAGK